MSDSDDEPPSEATPRMPEWGVVLAGLAPDASEDIRARGMRAAEAIAGKTSAPRNGYAERAELVPQAGHVPPIVSAMQALRRVPPEQLFGFFAGIRSLLAPNPPAYRSAPPSPPATTSNAAPATPATPTTSTLTSVPNK